MTRAATITCKVCHAVYLLLSDSPAPRGGERSCDICGHTMVRTTGIRMAILKFVGTHIPGTDTDTDTTTTAQ